MTSPLVSVLVPCHNAAPWLATALRSALHQTWPRVEVILVDDGSTDGSLALARRFESPRCRVLGQPKRGAAAARNAALRFAQGDFIQYLDADDFLAVDKIEHQVRAACRCDGLTFGSLVHHHENGRCHQVRASLPPGLGTDPAGFLAWLWSGAGPFDMIQTAQWLVPRELAARAGPWDEQLSVDDDGEYFSRVVLAARQLVPVPSALSYYRKFATATNLSAGRRLHHRKSSLQAARIKTARLLALRDDPIARRALQRLISDEIVQAYPEFPDLVREGLDFLERHRIRFALPAQSRAFRSLAFLGGWRTARCLQNHWRRFHGPVRAIDSSEPKWESLRNSSWCFPNRAG